MKNVLESNNKIMQVRLKYAKEILTRLTKKKSQTVDESTPLNTLMMLLFSN